MLLGNLKLSKLRRTSLIPSPASSFSLFKISYTPSILYSHQSLDELQQTPRIYPNQFKETQNENSWGHQNSVPFSPPENETKPACFSPVKFDFIAEKHRFPTTDIEAKRFHLEIIKYGFCNNTFLCNTLVNYYVRTGGLVCAAKLFDEMHETNSVTWALLISGCSRNGMFDKSFQLFREMICLGVLPSHYALGSALRACQSLGPGGLKLGLQVHALIVKIVYALDDAVCNGLISMYGSCDYSVDNARRVFECIKIKDSVSWNAIISVYSRRADAVSAIELFSSMQKEGSGFSFRPTEYTFGSLVTAASSGAESHKSLLEQILAKIERFGFLKDLYVGSALVSGFARVGMLDTAMKIFELMGARNAVSMNGLMVGLVRLKRGEAAFKVFTQFRDLVKVNSDSFVVLLSALAEFSSLEQGRRKGREVHAYVTRSGLSDSKVAIGNALINMYSKCLAIIDASAVFDLMAHKDVVSWSSIISGLDQNEFFEDALFIYRKMKRDGLVPSNFTLISALSSCRGLDWIRIGEQIHSEGTKLGLDLDVSVSNALLALYSDAGRITDCRNLFYAMPEHDQVSWNIIVGSFNDSEASITEAVGYFIKMMRAGLPLNKVTFINILGAISTLSLLGTARQIHALALKYQVMDDGAIENVLLACYGKCGEMNDSEIIFSKMSDRRNDVSWNCMISGYLQNELFPKAIYMVWNMLHSGKRLDSFTLATVLSACASVSTLERGMQIHACGIRASLEFDVVVGSALVDMYSKCGRIDYASRFFELMPQRNLYSWNSMISGYARHGHGHKALEIFEKMKLEGQNPDHVTFVGVLSACSHVGLVKQGHEHFESMTKVYGITPRVEHLSCMVDLLGRAGKLDDIEDFINRMPMSPNVLIWRTVLGACSRFSGRKTDLGIKAARMLMELEPQNGVNYVLLANMYASGGNWEDVADTRRAMRGAAAKKEAGCSWVTMNDGVHIFVAGDKSHPDKDAIYEKLRELHRKIRDAGYVPQIKFALYDLEQENKEELLTYHSERLAVAFVLTRRSELPIRIMKNLRVCGDCHSALKYISNIVRRQIILRDSNRFHHFLDGNCSCNDYW